MLDALKSGRHVVGARQTLKALNGGQVRAVFLAEDADPRVTEPLGACAKAMGVTVYSVPAMRTLGAACGIKVAAAVAALLL